MAEKRRLRLLPSRPKDPQARPEAPPGPPIRRSIEQFLEPKPKGPPEPGKAYERLQEYWF